MTHPTAPLRHQLAGLPATRPRAAALLAAALLAGCGGGGGAGGSDSATGVIAMPTPGPAVAALTATVSGRIADGPLAGATACYDLDDNGQCDAGDPRSQRSAADGSYTITVDAAAAGRHAVVADVPADAVAADTGRAVGTAYRLQAPATGQPGDQAVFVSPLTTLVAAHMQQAGADRSSAAAFVQQQAGLALSPLTDFIQATGDAAVQAARTARLVQLTALAQQAQAQGVVGSLALDDQPVRQADVDREAAAALLAALPQLAGTLIDPALQAASGLALQAQLVQAARQLALQIGPSAQLLQAAGAMQRLSVETEPEPTEPAATLRMLRYASSNNFSYRMFEASAADNQPDAQGQLRYYEWTMQASVQPGMQAAIGLSVTTGGMTQNNATVSTHWNGSAWVQRALHQRHTRSQPDPQGRSAYNYGDGLELGVVVRRHEDIADRRLADVASQRLRRFPGTVDGVRYADWGPADLEAYGDAVFPTGAQLLYQTLTVTSAAPVYNPDAGNRVQVYPADIAAGGDARATPSLPCNASRATIDASAAPAATLDALIARNRATPCIYRQNSAGSSTSLDPDSWWGNSTLNLGDLANANTLPAGTGTFYNTTASLRVGFAASGNRATFYRCYRRASDGSPRNCSTLGIGNWSIQTLGDARVLGFSVAPALAQKLGYARVFVERGGAVYFGSRANVGLTISEVRLDLTAANAVFHQLGLPQRRPITQPGTATRARAFSLARLVGAWGEADDTEATLWRFGPDGRFFMAQAKPRDFEQDEITGAELGWFDHDPETGRWASLLQVDSNRTAGTSHPGPSLDDGRMLVLPDSIIGNDGAGGWQIGRLDADSSATSLVGLWAVGSATDLSVPHLAFFRNGQVLVVTHGTDAACEEQGGCPPGAEFASWQYDAQLSGILRLNGLQYDTNGCGGMFRNCDGGTEFSELSRVLVIAASGATAVLRQSGGDLMLYRIAPR